MQKKVAHDFRYDPRTYSDRFAFKVLSAGELYVLSHYRFTWLNYVYLSTFRHTYKVESVIGFMTPFDDMEYVAALDKDVLYNIPLNAKIDVDILNKNLSLTLMPMSDNRVRMIQILERPYTSLHSLLDVIPIVDSKHTNMIKSRPIKQVRSSNGAAVFPNFKSAEIPNIDKYDSISF